MIETVMSPTHQIRQVLRGICDSELISPAQAPDSYLDDIGVYAARNLRRAILVLQVAATAGYPKDLASLQCFPWEHLLDEVVETIFKEQSTEKLEECRDRNYEALVSCIPAQLILETLCRKLLAHRQTTYPIRHAIVAAGAHYSQCLSVGDKPAFQLEAFVAQVMATVKQCRVS
eukprot:GHVQ01025787.1.p2 GENE.GHVQ01025787.1~~GHVQ01025787.1.p2  ORF type:complete len:174 (-),score=13.63 GHVQ01025787.1:284-805(-)